VAQAFPYVAQDSGHASGRGLSRAWRRTLVLRPLPRLGHNEGLAGSFDLPQVGA